MFTIISSLSSFDSLATHVLSAVVPLYFTNKCAGNSPTVTGSDSFGTVGMDKRNLASSPAGSLPDFPHVGIAPDDAGDLPLPPVFHSGAAPYSPRFTLIGSQDLDLNSHPNVSTLHSYQCIGRWMGGTLNQPLFSTVAAINQCAVDIGISVHKTVKSSVRNEKLRRHVKTTTDVEHQERRLKRISGNVSSKNRTYMLPLRRNGIMYGPIKSPPTIPAHALTANVCWWERMKLAEALLKSTLEKRRCSICMYFNERTEWHTPKKVGNDGKEIVPCLNRTTHCLRFVTARTSTEKKSIYHSVLFHRSALNERQGAVWCHSTDSVAITTNRKRVSRKQRPTQLVLVCSEEYRQLPSTLSTVTVNLCLLRGSITKKGENIYDFWSEVNRKGGVHLWDVLCVTEQGSVNTTTPVCRYSLYFRPLYSILVPFPPHFATPSRLKTGAIKRCRLSHSFIYLYENICLSSTVPFSRSCESNTRWCRIINNMGDYRKHLVRLLASHLGEPGSIPDGVAPVFSHVRIVPDDASVWLVSLGSSDSTALAFRPAPRSPHFTLIGVLNYFTSIATNFTGRTSLGEPVKIHAGRDSDIFLSSMGTHNTQEHYTRPPKAFHVWAMAHLIGMAVPPLLLPRGNNLRRSLNERELNTVSTYTRLKAKSKCRNRIRLESASQKKSSGIHNTPYDRESEHVNVDAYLRKTNGQFFEETVVAAFRACCVNAYARTDIEMNIRAGLFIQLVCGIIAMMIAMRQPQLDLYKFKYEIYRITLRHTPIKAVRDKVRTIEINLRKQSLLLPANILMGALSDIGPVKLHATSELIQESLGSWTNSARITVLKLRRAQARNIGFSSCAWLSTKAARYGHALSSMKMESVLNCTVHGIVAHSGSLMAPPAKICSSVRPLSPMYTTTIATATKYCPLPQCFRECISFHVHSRLICDKTENNHAYRWKEEALGYAQVKAVQDKVRIFKINLRKMSLLLHAYILTGALSDMRPVKLVTMAGNIYPNVQRKASETVSGAVDAARSVDDGTISSTDALPRPIDIANEDDAHTSAEDVSERMDINISRIDAMQDRRRADDDLTSDTVLVASLLFGATLHWPTMYVIFDVETAPKHRYGAFRRIQRSL
ncbi:hypothetical protein PR048_003490 [Dryococelus australis]|uniref:Uncharacterized protein n=1 Tax=Dryococelus australis TaxID=614101 RepID=A0ABQ9IN57_9NEOP|nr:hypothetical protein PR048_003490 [Dryococelus australis]